MVGRTNEWVANPLGLRQTGELQIKTRSAYLLNVYLQHRFIVYVKLLGLVKSVTKMAMGCLITTTVANSSKIHEGV